MDIVDALKINIQSCSVMLLAFLTCIHLTYLYSGHFSLYGVIVNQNQMQI